MDGGGFGRYLHHDSKLDVLLQSDGAFSEDVATGICQHIAARMLKPVAVDETRLPPELVALETDEAKDDAEKIAQGKIRKFYEEVTLLGRKFVRDETKQIKELLPAGTTLKAFVRYQVGAE